jgi:hypothetical protein
MTAARQVRATAADCHPVTAGQALDPGQQAVRGLGLGVAVGGEAAAGFKLEVPGPADPPDLVRNAT